MLLHLLIFRAVPGPHPCLPPAGEGEKARGIGEFTLTLSRKREREKNSLSHLWERAGVRGGGSSFFSFLSAKACKIGCWISLQINNDKKPAGGLHRQLR